MLTRIVTAYSPRFHGVAISVAAIVLAFATASVLLLAGGVNPIVAYVGMAKAAFGSLFAISVTVNKSLPRLLPALGIALSLRAGLWNIGAEGQLYIGAVACAAVALFVPPPAFPFGVLLALAAAAAAGAVWAAIPGVLRAFRGVSEVITSLMLVYVGIQVANYLIEGPWLVPHSTFPATRMFGSAFRLPILMSGTLLNAGVIVALVAAYAFHFITSRTMFGLWLRAVGGNERASRVIGLPVPWITVAAMAAGGAFAGLGGAVEILGVRGRLLESFSPGYGFQAIAIALLGRLTPTGIVASALVFGALEAGGAGLQVTSVGMSSSVAAIIEGLAVIYLLAGLGLVDAVQRRRAAKAELGKQQLPAAASVPRHDNGAGS